MCLLLTKDTQRKLTRNKSIICVLWLGGGVCLGGGCGYLPFELQAETRFTPAEDFFSQMLRNLSPPHFCSTSHPQTVSFLHLLSSFNFHIYLFPSSLRSFWGTDFFPTYFFFPFKPLTLFDVFLFSLPFPSPRSHTHHTCDFLLMYSLHYNY